MYLHHAQIKDVRALADVNLAFEQGQYAGWHVVLGDNGARKSTVIRAIALGLIGQREAVALRQNWADWLRSSASVGHIRLRLETHVAACHAHRQPCQLKREASLTCPT